MSKKETRSEFEAMSKNQVSTISVELEDGLEIDGTFTKNIEVRKPKVKDLLIAERTSKGKTEGDTNITFLANLTDLAPAQLEEMSLPDFRKLNEVVNGFLGAEDQT